MDNRTFTRACWRQRRRRACASSSSRRSSHGPTAPSTWTPRPQGSQDVEMACAQAQDYASATGRLLGGDAVQTAAADAPERSCGKAPAASAVAAGAGDAGRLRRRLRLVRGAGAPPLSQGGGGGACGPRPTHEGGALRQSLRRAALPTLCANHRVLDGRRGGRTSVVLAAEGHPLRPDGLRLRRPPRDVERIPRWNLGPGSCWSGPPTPSTRKSDEIRVAWLGVGRRTHPARRLWSGFPRAAYPSRSPHRDAVKETRFEGAAHAAAWVWAETGNFFLDHSYDDGSVRRLLPTPGTTTSSREGTEEWRKASALMDSVCRLADWLEEDLPGRFAEMLDFVLERECPINYKTRRKATMSE